MYTYVYVGTKRNRTREHGFTDLEIGVVVVGESSEAAGFDFLHSSGAVTEGIVLQHVVQQPLHSI